MEKYTIIKSKEGRYIFYKVIDSKGNEVAEFDAYNFQKPFHQAKEYIRNLKSNPLLKPL